MTRPRRESQGEDDADTRPLPRDQGSGDFDIAEFCDSRLAVTMNIYSHVSSTSTKEALKRLGNQFGEEDL